MILDRFRLDGKVALITGGTRGLGRGIAMALAEAGADVAVVSRTPSPDLEADISALGRRYVHHRADLTKREETRGVVAGVAASLGDVGILVNNSGIIPRAPAMEFPEADWDATLEIDLTAALILSQHAGRRMVEKGTGKIINTASVLSFQGGINVAAYTAAKHGLTGLTKTLANEWAGKGINVNAIAPGYFTTELTEALQKDPVRSKAILARIPAGRWGNPMEDIGGTALLLASSASDYINGSIITIDGGWMGW